LFCDLCDLDAYYPVCIHLDEEGCAVEFTDGSPHDFEPAPDVEWTEETVACLKERAERMGGLRCQPELAGQTIEDDTGSCTI
jgi:hypothetical protein